MKGFILTDNAELRNFTTTVDQGYLCKVALPELVNDQLIALKNLKVKGQIGILMFDIDDMDLLLEKLAD